MSSYGGVGSFVKLAKPEPETIIIGGVGRGQEVQRMQAFWPDAKIIGVEPLQEHLMLLNDDNYEHKFPGTLFPNVLWSKNNRRKLLHCNYEPDQRASLYPLLQELPNERMRRVRTITLDEIRKQTGPWGKTAMWLDIEGAELDAIKGLSDWSEVYWINIEVCWIGARSRPIAREITAALAKRGFEQIGLHTISKGKTQGDAVYVRREQWQTMCEAVCKASIERKKWRLDYRHEKRLERRRERK